MDPKARHRNTWKEDLDKNIHIFQESREGQGKTKQNQTERDDLQRSDKGQQKIRT